MLGRIEMEAEPEVTQITLWYFVCFQKRRNRDLVI
jgi:hypothetical protein